eukprot:scaffold381104_cov79-Cyclotella_meneghiniana.AAC.3
MNKDSDSSIVNPYLHRSRKRSTQAPLKRSAERTVVILYHKPANIITSHSSIDESPNSASERRRTVYEDIYSMNGYVRNGEHEMSNKNLSSGNAKTFEEVTGIKSKLHAIGRLDADTTGLLLLTNDGLLVHRITNPTSIDVIDKNKRKPIQKTYEAVIMGHHTLPHDPSANSTTNLSTLLTDGVALPAKHGGQTRPVDNLSVLFHPTRTTTCVSITISEGKNRQIRRMFHAIGSGVMRLHRVSVGTLTLGDLEEGQWRLLSDLEVSCCLGYECRYLDIAKGLKTFRLPRDNGDQIKRSRPQSGESRKRRRRRT